MFFTLALYQHMLSPDSVASHRVALPGSLKKADELFSSEQAAPEAEESIEEELVDEGEEKEEESGNDLVLLYLRDAGSVPLLTHQSEVELAQEIEAGRAQVQEAVFSFPFTLHRVFELAKKVETGDLPLQALLAESEVGERDHNPNFRAALRDGTGYAGAESDSDEGADTEFEFVTPQFWPFIA